ncbi:MAG TPA: M36 family metallopeptidase, partial [Flavisolibacter sp.]
YGFNEASGNFQADNMGRGGAGNDYVQAEAQDASGTNNANFSTPADGSRPRMQMYLFGGTATVKVNSPSVISGNYNAPESNFSTANSLASLGPVTGQVMYYNDNAAGTLHEACTPPVNALSGKIALIDRGNCNFTVKVKNAQDAGAIAVIMVNNVAGAPITMGGADNTITIPAVMISQSDGAAIKAQLGNNVNATLSAGVGRDGDFDNGIIVHEYGHGISNRLTGGRTNASCLNNAEQAGEGWSDYLAMMFTTNWANAQVSDGTVPRPMGTFAFGQPVNGGGIRAYPYSTDMSINPLTYGNIASNTQVHFVGTVWCTVLWDMTWNIIQQTGSIDPDIYNSASTSGNAIALRLVMEGMRLQPCRPGFLDSRDAILAADSILYNGAFRCAIWNAFARRGMGYSAVQGLSTVATDQVPAFDIPSTVRLTKSATPVIVSPGGQHTFTIAATCDCQASANGYIIRDTIPAGFSYVSSTGGSVSGNVLTFPALSFTAPQQTLTYQVTLKAESGGCIIDTAINDNREVNLAGGFVSAAATGTTQWVTSNARSKSPSTSWFAANNGTATDFTLTSAPFFLAGNLSVLSLWHYYVTENEIDGGRIELSTNGTTWTEISTLMVQNGYRKTTSGSSAWGAGQRVFTGVSYGQGSNQFINTVADLSVFNGQTVRLRLRMRSNGTNSGTYEGWFVDDISLMYGCGGLLKTGLFNNAGVKIDSAVVPVFVKSSLLPLTILSQPMAATACTGDNAQFSISVTGGSGAPAYQWQVSTNGGVSYSNIAGATQNTFTVPAVTSAMNGNRYRCVITGSSAISYSAGAELIVIAAPVPGTLTNATVCEGASVPFNAGASGSNLTYQWQTSSNGGASYTDVNGATAATFTLPALAAQNGVRVRVVVSNSCGASTSNAAIITVNPKPVITFQNVPADIVCSSDPAFQVTASPAGGTWGGAGTNGLVTPSFLLPGLTAVTYSVTSAAGCSATSSASFEVSSCAAQMLLVDAPGAIIIYPNPSNGRFSIKINTRLYQRLLVRVYATDGKLVRTQDLSGLSYGTVVPLNFMTLAGGMYMMSISDPVSGRELHEQLLIHRW